MNQTIKHLVLPMGDKVKYNLFYLIVIFQCDFVISWLETNQKKYSTLNESNFKTSSFCNWVKSETKFCFN